MLTAKLNSGSRHGTMSNFNMERRRVLLILAAVGAGLLLLNIFLLPDSSVRSKFKNITLEIPWKDRWMYTDECEHEHPICGFMKDADKAWEVYRGRRSKTFRETVRNYRMTYGRHPPPSFEDWYQFARKHSVHSIDDFDQIMDDLRPFWGVEPSIIRSLAAHLHEDLKNGISGLHIRDKMVWKLTNQNWRVETMAKMVKSFVEYLPDMDIAMNRLDQPRVVVSWDDMQALLSLETASRQIHAHPSPYWSTNMTGLLNENNTDSVIIDPRFFEAPGTQFMRIAKEACPPNSAARNGTFRPADIKYKDSNGFVTDFNRSSDLCVVGPDIQDKHGFLFASASLSASTKLLPVFGECKVNVNNDILFPANMYYMDDERYKYNPTLDIDWDNKTNTMIWRGVTSGGTNTVDNWSHMHRQRLVLLTNSTVMANKEVRILSEEPEVPVSYRPFDHFNASNFAANHTDVGFTEAFACYPDCHFYDSILSYKKSTTLGQQFSSKFLIDVDGHSFSGRWHAFLQSKSLAIKSTIFREWHDSRLFAWRHFAPLDNNYDELYSLLTYFIGVGWAAVPGTEQVPYISSHDLEARVIGRQGRKWAEKVLRNEDIEIYMFRLLIEYARVIDDNRDAIGYPGDGSELDEFDMDNPYV